MNFWSMEFTKFHLRQFQGMMMITILLVLNIGIEIWATPVPLQLTGTDAISVAKNIQVGKDLGKFKDTGSSRIEINSVKKEPGREFEDIGSSRIKIGSVKKEPGEDLSWGATDLPNEDLMNVDASIADHLEGIYGSGSGNSGSGLEAVLAKAEKDELLGMESNEEQVQRIKKELREVTTVWGDLQKAIVTEKRKAFTISNEGGSSKRTKGQSVGIWEEVHRMKMKGLILNLIKQYNRNFPSEQIKFPTLGGHYSNSFNKNYIPQLRGLSNPEKEWITSKPFGTIQIGEKNLKSSVKDIDIRSKKGQSSQDYVKELEAKSKEMLTMMVRKRAQSRILGWIARYNQKYPGTNLSKTKIDNTDRALPKRI